jgi:hypothetical protein
MHALPNNLLKALHGHSFVKNVRLMSYDETPTGKLEVKIRCRLIGDYQFQIWLHHELHYQDYAYQFFSDQPLLRWDNAPHYPNIATAPHHFHDENNKVRESPLTGNLLQDLDIVLSEIKEWLDAMGIPTV